MNTWGGFIKSVKGDLLFIEAMIHNTICNCTTMPMQRAKQVSLLTLLHISYKAIYLPSGYKATTINYFQTLIHKFAVPLSGLLWHRTESAFFKTLFCVHKFTSVNVFACEWEMTDMMM